MKNVWIAMILTSLFSSVQAQRNKTNFGISAGMNIASITDKYQGNSFTPDSRIGFKAFIFADAPITEIFSIQPEFGYDGLGFRYKDPNMNESFSAQINYLTLSVLPKLKVRNTGLSFLAGPTLGFLLNTRVSDEHGNSGSATDAYNSLDVFLAAGAQYFFRGGFGFNARYMAGLTNTIKHVPDGETVHNHAWCLGIAYRFH